MVPKGCVVAACFGAGRVTRLAKGLGGRDATQVRCWPSFVATSFVAGAIALSIFRKSLCRIGFFPRYAGVLSFCTEVAAPQRVTERDFGHLFEGFAFRRGRPSFGAGLPAARGTGAGRVGNPSYGWLVCEPNCQRPSRSSVILPTGPAAGFQGQDLDTPRGLRPRPGQDSNRGGKT